MQTVFEVLRQQAWQKGTPKSRKTTFVFDRIPSSFRRDELGCGKVFQTRNMVWVKMRDNDPFYIFTSNTNFLQLPNYREFITREGGQCPLVDTSGDSTQLEQPRSISGIEQCQSMSGMFKQSNQCVESGFFVWPSTFDHSAITGSVTSCKALNRGCLFSWRLGSLTKSSQCSLHALVH